MTAITTRRAGGLVEQLAAHASLDPEEFQRTIRATVVPAGASDEEFTAFLMVARKYNLDPITKEIYAFPKKGGGIQPIVSVDGWLAIINNHPEFDGMEFEDHFEGKELVAVTCRIYRKDRAHPTEVTEYMRECQRPTDTWKKWPARMLRHKATIQAARYAFGLSGIADPDEAERMQEAGAVEVVAEATTLQAALQIIAECRTEAELKGRAAKVCAELPDDDQAEARKAYRARLAELRAQEHQQPEEAAA